MAKKYPMKALPREQAGKGAARKLRRESQTPAVIYGDKKEPVKVSLDTNTINVEYNKGHLFTTLCEMDVSGEKHVVLARDVQLHPVTDNVEHVDFLRVTAKTKINVMVPVSFENQEDCPGLKEDGVLNVTRYEVELRCQATSIPDSVSVDLSSFNIGDSVKSTDIQLREGAKFVIDDREFTVATIAAPTVFVEEEETVEGEEGETAEGEDAAEGGEEASGEGDAPAEGEAEKQE